MCDPLSKNQPLNWHTLSKMTPAESEFVGDHNDIFMF